MPSFGDHDRPCKSVFCGLDPPSVGFQRDVARNPECVAQFLGIKPRHGLPIVLSSVRTQHHRLRIQFDGCHALSSVRTLSATRALPRPSTIDMTLAFIASSASTLDANFLQPVWKASSERLRSVPRKAQNPSPFSLSRIGT